MKDHKIKILLVAPNYPLIGGQVVQANRLLEKFSAEEMLEASIQPVNPRFFPRLQKIKYIRTFLTTIKYIFDLFRNIPKYDVIHIFSASYFSFLLAPTPAVLIAKLFRKKTILNYRSGEAEDHLTRWGKTAIPIIKLFDKVITPSGYLVDVFAKFGLKAEFIYNFVETDKYAFKERKDLKPIFLSNRNFEELYNIGCTLKAFAIIQKEYPDSKLFLVGDGNQKGKLRALAEDLELKNVDFVGRVSQSEMPEYYEKAEIYLNSPNIDNMPGSIIEAYAAGTPVISTNAGGIPYIVESEVTGLLVEINDHKKLASAAIGLIDDSELAKNLAENGRKYVLNFSWEKVRGEWLRTYNELLK